MAFKHQNLGNQLYSLWFKLLLALVIMYRSKKSLQYHVYKSIYQNFRKIIYMTCKVSQYLWWYQHPISFHVNRSIPHQPGNDQLQSILRTFFYELCVSPNTWLACSIQKTVPKMDWRVIGLGLIRSVTYNLYSEYWNIQKFTFLHCMWPLTMYISSERATAKYLSLKPSVYALISKSIFLESALFTFQVNMYLHSISRQPSGIL